MIKGVERVGGVFAAAAMFFVLSVALSAGCGPDREIVERQAKAAYQMGLAHLRENNSSKALIELTKANELSPDDHEILNTLGLAYWRSRKLVLAEEKFRKSAELKPDFSEAWNNLGALLIASERYEEAVEPLQSALSNVFYATRERALVNLGWALYKTGDVMGGVRRIKESLEVAPRFFLANKFLAMIHQDQGNHVKAVEKFKEALVTYDMDPETYLKLGLSMSKLGRKAEAAENFEKAWKLAPRSEVGKSAKTYLEFLR